MNDEGIVREVLTPIDRRNGAVKIKIGRATACEHCAASSVCAVRDVEVVARYSLEDFKHLKPGDAVKVDMPVRGGLKAAFIMYLLPLCGLGVGMTAGYFLKFPEWGSLLAGMAVMAMIYFFVAMNNRRFEANPEYMGRVVTVLDAGTDEVAGTERNDNTAGIRVVKIDTEYASNRDLRH